MVGDFQGGVIKNTVWLLSCSFLDPLLWGDASCHVGSKQLYGEAFEVGNEGLQAATRRK